MGEINIGAHIRRFWAIILPTSRVQVYASLLDDELTLRLCEDPGTNSKQSFKP